MSNSSIRANRTANRARTFHVLIALAVAGVVSFGCSKQEESKESILARAEKHFAAQQYDQAEKVYREVLRADSNNPTAIRQLGLIYHDQGQTTQAYTMLKRAAELHPDDVDVLAKLGLNQFALGGYKDARETALQVLEKSPGHPIALALFANTAIALNDVDETRKFIESLKSKDKDRPDYHLAFGMLALRQGDGNAAEKEFKTALALDPKSISAYSALGALYWSQKQLAAAEQALKVGADLSPERSPARLRYAEFKLQTGATADARALFEEMSKKFPDYLPPRVTLMKIVCAEKQDEDCSARVQNVLAQDPINFEAVFQDGLLSIGRNDAARAIRNFEYLRKVFQRNPQVHLQLARAYLLASKSGNEVAQRNAVDAAESRLAEAVELDPLLTPAVLLFAELKLKKGSAAAAIGPLSRLIRERPQIAQAYYLLGTAYRAQGQTSEVLALYQQMTKVFPNEAQPHFLLGTLQMAQNQPAQARQSFETAIKIAPDILPPVEMLVNLDIADKQYAHAMDRVQPRIDKDPKSAQLLAMRAKIYLAQQNLKQAEEDLSKAIELDPNLTPAYLLLARHYLASNQQERAVEKLRASIERNKNVPALLLLAQIQHQAKDFTAARDSYESIIALAPRFVPALNNLAVIYQENLGQIDRALEYASRAREIDRNDPNIADTLGWILFKKGDYRNALRILKEGAIKLADNQVVQFHLGMVHYMLGDEQSARSALEKAAAANTDFPGRSEAQQLLTVLAIDASKADATARTNLKKHLSQHPNDPIALARLAALQEHDGSSEQAIKTYEKIAREAPLFAPAIRRLALLYSQSATDITKAFEYTTKARQAYPDDPEIAKALGIVSYRRELYPRAVELLGQAAGARKADPEILYYLGDAHRHLKQWSACKSAMERALSLNLPATLTEQAKRSLGQCIDAL